MLDDGKGFDMSTVKLNNGIHNIRQRLHALDASYEFTSTPGKGTELNFNLFQRKKNLKNR
jgi:signal transduction histidine kinase